ncbi:hypothetical protein BDP27DRAFT_19926 [Rhodocollybia butyracea]|uniref:Uncharacterized protein n=1 Tax=Rhodocollybia butyracea TaxID=206335 RepID=A0A9P5UGN6_9AGAR|nr:hypothetical protein BDP27DRAFT_19926 [Rhodocollybia butyracea]
MQKCKELSRLKKAPRLSSILFRNQTPATSCAFQPSQKNSVLDPSHPAANARWRPPQWYTDALRVTATPFGLLEPNPIPLQKPFDIPIELWSTRITRSIAHSSKRRNSVTLMPAALPKFQRPGRLSMSLVTVVGKKATSKKKVIRLRIINKLKTAFGLVVLRAAEVKDGKLVLDTGIPRQHLIHQGWMYSVYPKLEVYRMPFTELVPTVLQLLEAIHMKIVTLENEWAQKSFQAHGLKLDPTSTNKSTNRISNPAMAKPLAVQASSVEHRNRRILEAELRDIATHAPLSFDQLSNKSSPNSSSNASKSFPQRFAQYDRYQTRDKHGRKMPARLEKPRPQHLPPSGAIGWDSKESETDTMQTPHHQSSPARTISVSSS